MSDSLVRSTRDADEILEAAPSHGLPDPTLSFGLSGVSDWSTQMPFIDLMKSARPWLGHVKWFGGKSNSELREEGVLDENGWPQYVPEGLRSVGTIWSWDKKSLAADARKGNYTISYDGSGRIELGGDAKSVVYEDGKITFSNQNGGTFWLNIIETDPGKSGDYIKNISLVRDDHLELHEAGAIFNPDWIQIIEDSRQIRFLDWMKANSSRESSWDDRGKITDSNWVQDRVPLEVMVSLSNQINADPWFTLPHEADDDYIENFAEYVKNNLNPNLKAHIELSNEVWNWNFKQFNYFSEKSKAEWDQIEPYEFYLKRATEVMEIWSNIFENQEARIVKVLGGQAVNTYLTNKLLSAEVWANYEPENVKAPSDVFDAFAITTYFGDADVSSPALRDELIAAINNVEVDEYRYLLDRLKDPNHPQSIPKILAKLQAQKELVASHGLDLIAYEGGQHVHHSFGVYSLSPEEQSQLQEFMKSFVNSESMASLYRELWDGWSEIGDGPFMHFQDVSGSNRYGSWGTHRSLTDRNHRSDLLHELNANEERWWSDDRAATSFQHGSVLREGSGPDRLAGTIHEDFLLGGGGDDTLFGSQGNDGLHGGEGWDIAEFNGLESEYTISDFGAYQIISGPDGVDRLFDIEEVRFGGRPIEQNAKISITGSGHHIFESDIVTDVHIENDSRTFIVSINRWSATGRELNLKRDDAAYAVYQIDANLQFGENIVKPSYHSIQENRMGPKGEKIGESALETALLFGSVVEKMGAIFAPNTHDHIVGRFHDDVFYGGGGRDVIIGRGGDDIIDGGSGADRLNAGRGNDLVLGGKGRDQIIGGGGNDTINGGEMNDFLKGSAGEDLFVFNDDFGNDKIEDYKSGEDIISFSSSTQINSFEDLTIEQRMNDVVIADGFDNSIRLKNVDLSEVNEDNFVF